MPTLSVSEKNHWRDRIAARIDRAVESIKSNHPALFDRARREAHAEALRSLGLAAAHAELETILAAEADLARRKKAAERSMLAALRGVPADEVPEGYAIRYGAGPGLPCEAAEAIARRQAVHQGRLLADDPIGREIGRLEGEKDNLLDKTWLVTSPAQTRTLWPEVVEVFGGEPTRPGRETPAIAPAGEG